MSQDGRSSIKIKHSKKVNKEPVKNLKKSKLTVQTYSPNLQSKPTVQTPTVQLTHTGQAQIKQTVNPNSLF